MRPIPRSEDAIRNTSLRNSQMFGSCILRQVEMVMEHSFRLHFPGRCIGLTTDPGDLVLDPFVGSGNSGVAALHHGCAFLGWDVSRTYLSIAKERVGKASTSLTVQTPTSDRL